MSKKQWMVLLMLFLTYLLLGASIFYHIESRLEIDRLQKAREERIEINALLRKHYVPSRDHDHEEILGKLTRYCGKSVYNYTEGETELLKWDFYNSFYFAYTVVSTIGYGNLAPTNMLGRILMIFYGLVGIPMNGILLTQLGEFFGHVFVKAHHKYKSYKRGRNDYYPRKLTPFETRKVGLAAQIFAYLTPGFVMFIFFPAFLFSHYEGWSYDEAVYYAFVTLTTIGFGDYVAGQDNSKGSGVFFILYKTFLICWISFGLGYIVMIMTFIARGMRSKKITRIEHKLAVNLKHTQSKIWNEFNKEISYLRRVFNELQLSKVKRVYVDECDYEIVPSKLPRSNSFPDLRDLTYGRDKSKTTENGFILQRPRRRANSEVVPMENQVARVVSETDLQRIDKTATFAAHAMVQPAELLARLVNVLGYIPPVSEDVTGGGSVPRSSQCYVEQDAVLARSEESGGGAGDGRDSLEKHTTEGSTSSWAIGSERIVHRFSKPLSSKPRSRAASEIRLRETRNDDRNVEWTWSGSTASKKMQELMKARSRPSLIKDRPKDPKSTKFRTLAFARSVPKALLLPAIWKRRFSANTRKKSSGPDVEDLRKTETTRGKEEAQDIAGHSFFSATVPIDDRRDSTSISFTNSNSNSNSNSISNAKRHYYTHTGAANTSHLADSSNLLEETSLADFLRALMFLRASVDTVGTVDTWSGPDDDHTRPIKPRRKMGTASLTPPKLPSLFTLFSSAPVGSNASGAQSQSNQSTVTRGSNGRLSLGTFENKFSERGIAAPVAATVKPRRFSLRPVATPVSPPTPPKAGSPFLSNSHRETNNGGEDRGTGRATFRFESPKEPLLPTEGTPSGVSLPMKPPFSRPRRSSLRPRAQNQTGNPSTVSGPSAPTLKAAPRWRAGMLQRQISQMNLRRRVRAFSLSDVNTDVSGKKTNSLVFSNSMHAGPESDATRKIATLLDNSSDREAVAAAELRSRSYLTKGGRTSLSSPSPSTVSSIARFARNRNAEETDIGDASKQTTTCTDTNGRREDDLSTLTEPSLPIDRYDSVLTNSESSGFSVKLEQGYANEKQTVEQRASTLCHDHCRFSDGTAHESLVEVKVEEPTVPTTRQRETLTNAAHDYGFEAAELATAIENPDSNSRVHNA